MTNQQRPYTDEELAEMLGVRVPTTENDDQEQHGDVLAERVKTTVHDRLVRRTCEWCGDPIDYSGVGRPPRYCKDSHRKRASELRTAQARADRPVDAGGRTTEPVREVIERTETVTRTVVRRGPGEVRRIPAARASGAPYTLPEGAQEWFQALQYLAGDAQSGRFTADQRAMLAGACEAVVDELRRGSGLTLAPYSAPVAQPALSRAERRRREREARKHRG
ncbi:hypothetical protein [Streptomyces melanogenes]|uniref:hypothetical protein n=1 Tax=Streptomyces melanogenes TaxID=67326 RepID=UPI00167D0E17|nr:hypothetical protein [Streptomyces melanogenes]GGP93561.1 hypothetical protein GCM10010278_84560 [Streptomyces melanogenes]